MPNRRLTSDELASLRSLLSDVRERLDAMAEGDTALLFALRRDLAKRLTYDERQTSSYRIRLKRLKWLEQNGHCAICDSPMELNGSELDRADAILGYSITNTRLVHHDCHVNDQRLRGFTDEAAISN